MSKAASSCRLYTIQRVEGLNYLAFGMVNIQFSKSVTKITDFENWKRFLQTVLAPLDT